MFCQNCGKEISNHAKFCPFCGCAQEAFGRNDTSQPLYSEKEEQNGYQYGTGGDMSRQPDTCRDAAPSMQQFPMKWYHFVIWVQLFLASVFAFFTAFQYFTGGHYGEGAAELVYSYYGSGLKILDMIMAVCCVASIVWALYARQQLKNFRRQAPRVYIGYLCFYATMTIGYLIGASAITKEFLLDTENVTNLITTIIMIVLNKIYFKKRASLFVQ